MVVLGVDIETTGLDPKQSEVTELGIVLYDLEKKFTIYQGSHLIMKEKHDIPKEVEELTGITNELRTKWGVPKEGVKESFQQAMGHADYLMAHNAGFEQSFLGKMTMPWIDTATDLPYPPTITTRKLTYLAAEHGVCVRTAHRALEDVKTMIAIASHYDPAVIKKYADSPSINVRACVGFETKDLAKERGYRWNGEKKIWVKPLKEFQLNEEMDEAPFQVEVI